MEKWMMKNIKYDFNALARELKVSPVLAKLLVNRGVYTKEDGERFLNIGLENLYSPLLLKDMDVSIELMKEAILNNKSIMVVGDYDVDGVISTYILYKTIKKCGGNVDYHIPHRINEGYGINENIIKECKNQNVDLIITCDNGIAALDSVKLCRKLGMNIIVTDHHDIPFIEENGERVFVLPEANAIINPKRKDCEYPFKSLCGAGVAFKFCLELLNSLGFERNDGYELLEFVAIATVCDVVDLIDENRDIVTLGLRMINNTSNLGLKKLISECGLDGKTLGVYHLGFIIGPCINATGRLEEAKIALKLLLSEDEKESKELANLLCELNNERKNMTQEGVEKAINIIENSSMKNLKVLVVYLSEVHESIAGIIAGRIRERFNKPTFVLTSSQEGVKGSGRSIEEYNMFEELLKCKDLLLKFGGHPMAAGLSLSEENIDLLRDRLNEITNLKEEDLVNKITLDMGIGFSKINFSLEEELKKLEPFGKSNPKPLFGAKNVKVIRANVFGNSFKVLKLRLFNENVFTDGIFFGDIDEFEKYIICKFGEESLKKIYDGKESNVVLDLVFNIDVNEYKGNKSIQLQIKSYR